MYEIDLVTNAETRVSATTIPLSSVAAITPNGRHVMIQAGRGAAAEVVIGTVSPTSADLSNFAVTEPVTSFAATSDNQFLYAVPTGNETVVKQYTPATNAHNYPVHDSIFVTSLSPGTTTPLAHTTSIQKPQTSYVVQSTP